ncbi:helix-turn-helix domain-containing protein [Halalkalicoccus sp. NIPERK01]|uniref:helix-turn-helix domain-containing protein n=1 Tax=Halalkalicoccus sp. NIPERK01 TaxID=3053469 RepID=UPI00256F6507|nr:helix-turn-helix domain-containing protein [Halalkalicoccus sp. NIPERK01]MDL5363037.1 helix-turn-helix domain-containing protein [Halalkalicoccus sp. NIPERK01]
MNESTIVQTRIPADRFLLAETMARGPDLVYEAEPFVLSDSDLFPYLWVRNHTDVDFEVHAEGDPTVRAVERLAAFDHEILYRVHWNRHGGVGAAVEAIVDEPSAVLQASGRDGEWEVKLRFDSKAAASAFHDACAATDVRLHISQVHREDGPRTSQWSLTTGQRQALVTALEMGYFDVPRGATAEEVSDALGISDAALSQRLRRATTNLVSNTITIGGPTGVGHPDAAADERAGGS